MMSDGTYGVYFNTGSAGTIKDNNMSNNDIGIRILGTSSNAIQIGRNTITYNRIGISCDDDAQPYIGNSENLSNDIYLNTDFGVQNLSNSVEIDASYNWWGDENGPYHETINPQGGGNEVSNNVLFNPYLSLSNIQDDDEDGTSNYTDNCLYDYNPDQNDIDGDNIGDVCDSDNNDGPLGDGDGDGIHNEDDMYPNDGPTGDWDGDGIVNNVDPDDTDNLSADKRRYAQGTLNTIVGNILQDTQPYMHDKCQDCYQGTDIINTDANATYDPGPYDDRPSCDPETEYLEQGTNTCIAR